MDPLEIKLVRQYAINEVDGGLMIGRMAMQVEDPFLRAKMTFHSYDELRHGWLWTEFLEKRKIGVAKARMPNRFFDYMEGLREPVPFLAALHVYELRVPFHLGAHARHPDVDPELKGLIEQIEADEDHHLSWVRDYLVGEMGERRDEVIAAVREAQRIEDETYRAYVDHLAGRGGYMGRLAEVLRPELPSFTEPAASFEAVEPGR